MSMGYEPGFSRGPRCGTSREWGSRARRLRKTPGMHPVSYGLWANSEQPLSHVQRTVLLQRHLDRPENPVRLTGVSALLALGLPLGSNYRWGDRALGFPAAPRGDELALVAETVHSLAWVRRRRQTQRPHVVITKSLGFPPFQGPWGSTTVHPVEALTVAAPLMSRWSVVACLDAMLMARNLYPVSETAPGAASGFEPWGNLSLEQIGSAISALPLRSRPAESVRRAFSLARCRTASPMETLVRLMIVRSGLPEPVMNHEVITPHGRSIIDAAWPDQMVGIEYNGRIHTEDFRAYKDEMYRNEVLRDQGWRLRILVFDDLRIPRRAAKWLTWLGERLRVEPRLRFLPPR